MAHIAE